MARRKDGQLKQPQGLAMPCPWVSPDDSPENPHWHPPTAPECFIMPENIMAGRVIDIGLLVHWTARTLTGMSLTIDRVFGDQIRESYRAEPDDE